MKLLAIDTSTDYLVIAVTDGNKVLSRLHKSAPRSHSSLLMPMIDKALKKAGVRLRQLGAVCIGTGPGSFTGLRIGVSTVKGLSFAASKPILAIPTFDAIALNAKNRRGIICVVLDARKNKVYAAFYKSDGQDDVRRLSPYLLLGVPELLKKCEEYDNLYFLGDYAGRLPGVNIAALRWHPRAENIARLGMQLYNKKKFIAARDLEPMYIYSRECDIKGI